MSKRYAPFRRKEKRLPGKEKGGFPLCSETNIRSLYGRLENWCQPVHIYVLTIYHIKW
jgi:hypothetical protein